MNRNSFSLGMGGRFHQVTLLNYDTVVQKNRIIADGGTIVDLSYMDMTIRRLKQLGIYGNTTLLMDANFAVKKDATGAVSKLYDISGKNNDAFQNTGASQPIFIPNSQNGKAEILYDGIDDTLMLPVIEHANSVVLALKSTAPVGESLFRHPMGSSGELVDWHGGENQLFYHSPVVYASSVPNYENGELVSEQPVPTVLKIESIVNSIGYTESTINQIGWGQENYFNRSWKGVINTTIALDLVLSEMERREIESVINRYYQIY